jgi:hypothetical protein
MKTIRFTVLNKKELIWIATMAIVKEMSTDDIMMTNQVEGSPEGFPIILDYIGEIKDIGVYKFIQKYKGFSFFPGFLHLGQKG